MKKLFLDLLADPKTQKWSLGRIFAFLFLLQLFILTWVTVIREHKIPDIPSNYLMLLLILLGYNTATKYVNGYLNKD